MTAISLAAARDTLSELLDKVTREHEPIIIRKEDGQAAVLVALADYEEERDETVYLLRDPATAAKLLRGMEQSKAGLTKEHPLNLDS